VVVGIGQFEAGLLGELGDRNSVAILRQRDNLLVGFAECFRQVVDTFTIAALAGNRRFAHGDN